MHMIQHLTNDDVEVLFFSGVLDVAKVNNKNKNIHLYFFTSFYTYTLSIHTCNYPYTKNLNRDPDPFPIVDLVIQNYNPKCIFTYLQNHISGNTSPPSIPPLTHNTPNQTTNITIKQQ